MRISEVKTLLAQSEFFAGETFQVINENLDDLHPKCFLVLDKVTKKKFKVRINIRGFEESIKKELTSLNILKSVEFPYLPSVFSNEKVNSTEILIYQYFPGVSLAQIKKLTSIDHQIIVNFLVTAIEKLHSIDSRDCNKQEELESWEIRFNRKILGHLQSSEIGNEIDSKSIQRIEAVIDKFSKDISQEIEVFLHYDIKPKNIIYNQPNSGVYLIDFELCRFGDPLMEFARLKSFSINGDYEKLIVTPILEHFEKRHDFSIGRNLFSFYLMYCYLVYTRFHLEQFKYSQSITDKKSATYWKKKLIEMLRLLELG